jgi:predicted DNA-binding WGR domain protein
MPAMALEIRDGSVPKGHGVPKPVIKKLAALGTVSEAPKTWRPLWNVIARPVADGGWIGVVETGGVRKAALVGAKDKTARLVEGYPDAKYVGVSVTADGRTAYLDMTPDAGGPFQVHALDVATGVLKRVYEGPPRDFEAVAAGLLVARDGDAVILVEPDGAAGRVLASKPVAPVKDNLGVCHGGRVVVAFRDGPSEAVVLGVYPGEADPLRVIGTVAHDWGGYAFQIVEGRCLFQAVKRTWELTGFADAYEQGRAGEVVKKAPEPGQLAWTYVDVRSLMAPQRVDMLQAIRFERDEVVPCAGAAWVTRLEYSRKRSAIALVDDATLAVRTVELPPGEYSPLKVDASGTRARTVAAGKDALEIALPALTVRPAGPAGDFGPDASTVVPGVALLRADATGHFAQVGSLGLVRPHSVGTALDGRVVVAYCSPKGGPQTVAVLGIYGDELRLLGRLEAPPGNFLGWKRRGPRLIAWCPDCWEIAGLAEAWERGKNGPGLPLGDLQEVLGAPVADKPRAPAATPRLDALIAGIRRSPRRASVPATHARLLAGALPEQVRRVVEALAEHADKYATAGPSFYIGDKTLDCKIPGPGGTERDDLLVIGEDGGGNLYAIDLTEGAESPILFVDHEADFAESHTGRTLEHVLEKSFEGAEEEDDEEEQEEDDEEEPDETEEAPRAAAGARRFTSTEGGSSKFWEAAVEGSSLTVKFGKIGTAGQTKTKAFASPAAATAEMNKLVKEKLGKGYVEGS